MSLLEQLARKRVEKSKGLSNADQSQNTSKSASLLERLHKNRGTKDRNAEIRKKDLKSLLAKDKIKRSDCISDQHTISLSLKLSALKKSNSDLERQEKSVTPESKENEFSTKGKSFGVKLNVEESWDVINEINRYCLLKDDPCVNQADDFALTNFIMNGGKSASSTEILLSPSKSSSLSLKRHYDELLGIFVPSTLPKKSRNVAIENFNRPSPDDIILSAQLNAFNEKLENLNIKSPLKTEKKESINLQTAPTESIDIHSFIATHPLNLTCLFLGATNSGKSTLLGHLLYELNEISIPSMRELQKKSSNLDSIPSNSFKIILDNTKTERMNGFSMFKKIVQIKNNLLPPSSSLTLIDTPGNIQYFDKETVNSILTFDPEVYALVIDCNYDSWEKSLDGPNNQIYKILKVISYLNEISACKKHLIILLNKADLISWDKQRLEMIQSELTYVLTENFQWKEAQFQFIPCSGLLGSNLNNVKKITKSKYKSEFDAINDVPEWYEGPTFFSQLYFLMELNMNKIETTLEEPFIGLILQSSVSQPTAETHHVSLKVLIKSGYIQSGQTIEIHTQHEEIHYYGIITRMKKSKLILETNIKNNLTVGVKSDILEILVKIHNTEDLAKKEFHIHKDDLIIHSRKANTLLPNLPNTLKLLSLRLIKLSFQTRALNGRLHLGSELLLYHNLTYSAVKLVKIHGTNDTSINPNQSLIVEVEIMEPNFALKVIDSKYVTNNIFLTSIDHKVIAAGRIICQ
ncbi:Ski7p [Saccharomyces paradoxus]|uniref:Ski7p n=1 Tax=Saccharomyces paradoxus TaxID=27291 RepID=A0A8B8UZN0_SACPA|nr:Ski7 [Saccharomyces paradoxus]QHS76185.1 Ski7 [Saccharomyces paradoxus]